jgi:hypothetical protein
MSTNFLPCKRNKNAGYGPLCDKLNTFWSTKTVFMSPEFSSIDEDLVKGVWNFDSFDASAV